MQVLFETISKVSKPYLGKILVKNCWNIKVFLVLQLCRQSSQRKILRDFLVVNLLIIFHHDSQLWSHLCNPKFYPLCNHYLYRVFNLNLFPLINRLAIPMWHPAFNQKFSQVACLRFYPQENRAFNR